MPHVTEEPPIDHPSDASTSHGSALGVCLGRVDKSLPRCHTTLFEACLSFLLRKPAEIALLPPRNTQIGLAHVLDLSKCLFDTTRTAICPLIIRKPRDTLAVRYGVPGRQTSFLNPTNCVVETSPPTLRPCVVSCLDGVASRYGFPRFTACVEHPTGSYRNAPSSTPLPFFAVELRDRLADRQRIRPNAALDRNALDSLADTVVPTRSSFAVQESRGVRAFGYRAPVIAALATDARELVRRFFSQFGRQCLVVPAFDFSAVRFPPCVQSNQKLIIAWIHVGNLVVNGIYGPSMDVITVVLSKRLSVDNISLWVENNKHGAKVIGACKSQRRNTTDTLDSPFSLPR